MCISICVYNSLYISSHRVLIQMVTYYYTVLHFAWLIFDIVPYKNIWVCVYIYIYMFCFVCFVYCAGSLLLPAGSVVLVQRLSCPKTSGIFQDQESNPSLLH